MTSLILAGVGIAGTALVLRAAMGSLKHLQKHTSQLPKASSLLTSYYKGGFESKMTRREASLILGRSMTILYKAWKSVVLVKGCCYRRLTW